MKAVPIRVINDVHRVCAPNEATHIILHMPGPIPDRIIPVILHGTRSGTHCWSWNGDTEKPTLKPSIVTRDGKHTCHTWVNDGQAIFLGDCTHELKGQTVALLDVEGWTLDVADQHATGS